MGLFFDNDRSSCDWEENVTCEKDLNGGGGNDNKGNSTEAGDSGNGGEGQGAGTEKVMASALTGANAKSEAEGDDGAQEAAAWNGGSDWGGAWVQGVW